MPDYSTEGEFKDVADHGNVGKSRHRVRIDIQKKNHIYCGENTERNVATKRSALRRSDIYKPSLFGFTVRGITDSKVDADTDISKKNLRR